MNGGQHAVASTGGLLCGIRLRRPHLAHTDDVGVVPQGHVQQHILIDILLGVLALTGDGVDDAVAHPAIFLPHQAMEHMETMAALSLSVVLRECKQMGTALTVEQGVRFLESHILPHQNRSILKNRADEIAMQFQSVLAKNNRQGIRTQAEKKEVASAWLELAISCAKVPVKYEADEIKRRQKEEKTQRETEPVMA